MFCLCSNQFDTAQYFLLPLPHVKICRAIVKPYAANIYMVTAQAGGAHASAGAICRFDTVDFESRSEQKLSCRKTRDPRTDDNYM